MPNFREGQKFYWQGAKLVVVKLRLGDKVEVENLDNGTPTLVDLKDLLASYQHGELRFLSSDNQSQIISSADNNSSGFRDRHTYPVDTQKIIDYRFGIIEPLLNLPDKVRHRAVHELAQNMKGVVDHSGKKFPSASTIFRWIKLVQVKKTKFALAPDNESKGAPGVHKLNTASDTIIEQVINEIFLVPEKCSARDVHYEVERRVERDNSMRSSQSQLEIPSYATVARRVAEIDPRKLYEAKHGKRATELYFAQIGKSEIVNSVLERVEIDHTILDVIVAGTKARLRFTEAFDVCTKNVLGWDIGFDPPGFEAVQSCLFHALLPKTDMKERYGTVNDYLPYGCPTTLVVDNGLDFVGKDLLDSCYLLDIDLARMPPGTPQYKGGVERFHRTLEERVIHPMPGTTFSNPQQRGDYDSVSQAVVTVDEIDTLIARFIVDDYSQSFHEGLGAIPAKEWERKTRFGFTPNLPPNVRDLKIMLGRVTERTIQASGISFKGWRYNCADLGSLRDRLDGKKVKIKYHSSDIGCLYVLDPFEKHYIDVPVLPHQGYEPGMSLWKRLIMKQLKNDSEDKEDTLAIAQARYRQRNTIQDAGKQKKLATKQEARLAQKPKNVATRNDTLSHERPEIDDVVLSDNTSTYEIYFDDDD